MLLMIASATIFAISCDKENEPGLTPPTEQPENPQEPEGPENPEDPKIEYTLSVAPDAFMEIPAEGATMNLSVTANASWTIAVEYTGDADNWLELSTASGDDNADVSITALSNEIEAMREAVIMVSLINVDTTCTASVSVSQLGIEPFVPELSVNPDNFADVDAEGWSGTLSIVSNTDWTIAVEYEEDTAADWIELSAETGNGDSDIEIVIMQNATENQRLATLKVSTSDLSVSYGITVSQLAGEPLKTYTIGQEYDENGKKGIIFYVTDDGHHGKIVSESSKELIYWSTENSVTGATDMDYGMNNMKIIQEIEGWEEKFPAFAWCAALGEGWYLPAQNELNTIDRAGILPELFNDYWSSTEYSEERAYAKSFYTAEEYQYRKCVYPVYVRAVCEF